MNKDKEVASFIINIECPDKIGLVYLVCKEVYDAKCNIINLKEHVEPKISDDDYDRFFARLACVGLVEYKELQKNIEKVIGGDHYDGKVVSVSVRQPCKKKIVLFATKEVHCLGDILLKNEYNMFNANVCAVIANRIDTKKLCDRFEIPFYYVPYNAQMMQRENHEKELLKILEQYNPEYIILARYMRILSEGFVLQYRNKIINIHHSFLPAFIGANPYRQAYNRGVKIIGATAHFASKDLDEGPIITQQILRIDHTYGVKQMQSAGRDIERTTLAQALALVFDDRVFVCNNKTIIL